MPELVHKLPPNAAAEEAKGLIDHAKREPPAEPSSPSVRCECDGGPGSKGERMLAFSEPACKHCGGKMDMVADISPQGREPGLRAFVCSECGTVDSVLIDPDNYFGPKDPTEHGKRC